jgi:hypothetical protein
MQQGVMTLAITFRLFLETNEETKPFEECSKEDVQAFTENASKRLSDTMSRYYTQHTEEYEQI